METEVKITEMLIPYLWYEQTQKLMFHLIFSDRCREHHSNALARW